MFISLGYLSIKMLIPILIPVIYTIRHILLDTLDKKFFGDKEKKHHSVFLHTFLVSISYSINIILYIVEYKITQSDIKKIQEKEFDNQLIIEKLKIKKKKKKYRILFLILLSFFNFFNYLFYDILEIFKPNDYNKILFYPLSIPVFFIITAYMSFLFLNYKFYFHQKTSMIISLILSICLFAILIIYIIYVEKKNISLTSFLFLIEFIGIKSLRYILFVFGKLFIEKMFVSHIKLMAFLGIFGIVFSLIGNSLSFLIKMNFVENPDKNDFFKIENGKKRLKTIFDSWGNFDVFTWPILIGIILLWFAENYIVWFCISTFSPNHFTIYSSISSIFALIIELIELKDNNYDLLLISSVFLILCGIFISTLIFNEIIIIRFYKMDINTNVEINRRQKEEKQNIKIRYSDTNNSNNNDLTENSFNSEISNKNERDSKISFKSD